MNLKRIGISFIHNPEFSEVLVEMLNIVKQPYRCLRSSLIHEKSRRILDVFKELQIPHVLVTTSIFLSHFVFVGQDVTIFLSFVALIPIFTYFKFDARIPVGYAILMLISAATVLAFYKNEALANQLSIYAYWLLVVGVTCLTIEYVREQRKSKKQPD